MAGHHVPLKIEGESIIAIGPSPAIADAEVTAEMVDAGRRVLVSSGKPATDALADIYRAMERAAPHD